MQRTTASSFVLVLALSSCASQPICPPWAPTTSSATAPPAAAPSEDDGTVALAGPSADETWGSVVGTKVDTAASSHADHARVEPGAASPAPAARKPRVDAARADRASATKAVAAQPTPAAAQAVPIAEPLGAEARAFYAGRCVPCHGESGRGDGPTGKVLQPTPRNFTDRAWQGSVTDAHIEKVILNGGPSVGKSPLMPAHGDLGGNRELLAAMRRLVRGFGS